MKKLDNLAPLHNPIQIKTIERCLQVFPQIPQDREITFI